MSKILNLLNYNKFDGKIKDDKHGFSGYGPSEDFDSNTKEKLAATYILNSIDNDENDNKNLDKIIIPHKHNSETYKIKSGQFVPWLISFLAVLLLLVNIAYRGKINIKIEIAKEGPAENAADISKNVIPKNDMVSDIEAVDPTPISIDLFEEGQLNKGIIKRLGFYGAASSKSKLMQDDGLFLFNDGTAGWASVGLDLAKATDLSSSTLDFFVKGVSGNESLKLFLRDAGNKSYMPQANNIIFDKNMGKDWQFVSVTFNNFNGTYNPKMINHVGIEFGTQTTLNEPGSSIYIKNIKIVKVAGDVKGTN